ncbi:MAG TPA: phosphoribosylformylglycinamidine cyclo-ligase [Candidatus Aquicultor sp.]|jgi:phosphoribosylformylglycinamidine cyclo-ligase
MVDANNEGLTYKDAGVDIKAGEQVVEFIKKSVRSTFRPGVLTDIGGFGGLFGIDTKRYKEPVLVSGTDGVGTKLKIAQTLDIHDTVGIDLVAMCVNDILVQGAEPLFYLDYFATGALEPHKTAAVIEGIAEGCRQAGCALLGGETAEMPGFYAPGEYDLAGFAVGIVDKPDVITGETITEGDVIIGLASSGLHSNGYSLARKLVETKNLLLDTVYWDSGKSLGLELLKPTKIYVKPILKLMQEIKIKGLAHITGGGLTHNIPRILPAGVDAELKLGSWDAPPIFAFMEREGNIAQAEMLQTFNMGIGMAIVVDGSDLYDALKLLIGEGETTFEIGRIAPGTGVVRYV